MFEAIYTSLWQQPAAFWACGAVFALLAWRKLSFLAGFTLVFLVEILGDAWLTSDLSPAHGQPAAQWVAIAFVVLGDYRYFLLLGRFGRRHAETALGRTAAAGVALRALAFALVVPLASIVPQKLFPDVYTTGRPVFLTYELLFAALALGVLVLWLPRVRPSDPAVARWLTRLTLFELVQYVLWALADVVILLGVDAGFLLRLIPNAMYYCLFLPFAFFAAPPALGTLRPVGPRPPAPEAP
ncbi:MAG: hypothetical protein IT373_09865 [Polyangiaceae bacterium]|nr:hypothetical protein [Polyangiaceae bacterium]